MHTLSPHFLLGLAKRFLSLPSSLGISNIGLESLTLKVCDLGFNLDSELHPKQQASKTSQVVDLTFNNGNQFNTSIHQRIRLQSQRSRGGLTWPLYVHSVGTYQETSSQAARQGTLGNSRLSSLSHYGLILA